MILMILMLCVQLWCVAAHQLIELSRELNELVSSLPKGGMSGEQTSGTRKKKSRRSELCADDSKTWGELADKAQKYADGQFDDNGRQAFLAEFRAELKESIFDMPVDDPREIRIETGKKIPTYNSAGDIIGERDEFEQWYPRELNSEDGKKAVELMKQAMSTLGKDEYLLDKIAAENPIKEREVKRQERLFKDLWYTILIEAYDARKKFFNKFPQNIPAHPTTEDFTDIAGLCRSLQHFYAERSNFYRLIEAIKRPYLLGLF